MNVQLFKDLPAKYQNILPIVKQNRLLQPANADRMEVVNYLLKSQSLHDITRYRKIKYKSSNEKQSQYPILPPLRLSNEEREYRYQMMQNDDLLYGSGITENWDPNLVTLLQIDDEEDYQWIEVSNAVSLDFNDNH